MKTNKSILDFIPQTERAKCSLGSDDGAKYIWLEGRKYLYLVYLTRYSGSHDCMWKVDYNEYKDLYTKYHPNLGYDTNTAVAVHIAHTRDADVTCIE